ncbi:hypothetical protein BANRA_00483 [Klebsiella pneumoniae]|nr:hypothetical protein BANRA_02270 [Klebsiella pneumoniae]VCX21183.1 hypothetical protein BANRA_00822 [Klebsiella pneumoniae]VDA32320.1 hypothetical protein BANRA_00483 [Klebsiella pneumoniae]VDA65685.1 hypothetical protein BANRA_02829 [Klebsiella pneumoniae]
MTTKNYTAFVSHSWDYDKQLKNLKSLIEKIVQLLSITLKLL